mgnify:CR=1 FL=1
MKSNKLLLINGVISLIGALTITYLSSKMWKFEIIYWVIPKLVRLSSWDFSTCLILLFFGFVAFLLHDEESKVNKKTYQFLLIASIIGFIPILAGFSSVFAFVSAILYLMDYIKLSKK